MSTLKGIPVVIVESGGVPITLSNDAPLATNVPKVIGGWPVTIDEHVMHPHAIPLNVENYNPTPSPPSAPYEFHVPEVDGLVSHTEQYTASTGRMLVRIFGRSNNAAVPQLSVKWAGEEMELVTQWPPAPPATGTSALGGPYSAIFALPNGQPGTHDLEISCTIGEVGVAAVRIAEAAAVGGAWEGPVSSYGVNYGFSSGDVYGVVGSDPGETMFVVTGWVTDLVHPITVLPYGAYQSGKNVVTQWSTWVQSTDGQYTTSAAFGICTTSDEDRTFIYVKPSGRAGPYCASVAQINGVVM